jgi:hypothetical protein
VRSTPTALSEARGSLAATTVGSYALVGGGYSGSRSSVVDAYTERYQLSITIPALSKYKFDGYHSSEQTTVVDKSWNTTSDGGGITGYIKRGNFTLSGLIS